MRLLSARCHESRHLISMGVAELGSLFLGSETTVACGDKAVGTNRILPAEEMLGHALAAELRLAQYG